MSDTGNGGAGQEPTAGSQQAGQEPSATTTDQQGQQGTPTGQEPTNGGTQAPDLSTLPDDVRSYVETVARQAAEARQEAARYRTERNGLQSKVTEFQQANETAEQRAQREAEEHQQRLATLEAENKALRVGGQWTTAATAAKALDPGALLALVGGVDKVETDESGKATNLDALLSAAKQQYPWAFARPSTADGGAGAGGGVGPTGGGINDFIRNRGR